MPKYTVSQLLDMEQSEIDDLIGLTPKREEFLRTLEEASEFTGEKLKEFEARLNKSLNPEVYVEGLKFDLERIENKARKDIAETCGCPVKDWD